MVTKSTRKSRSAPLRRRTAQRAVTRTAAETESFFETETGKMVMWGAVGFLGIVLLAGVAGVLYETDAIDARDVRRFQTRVRDLPRSPQARQAMSWLNSRLSELRDEFTAQLQRLS
jgi:hypothetical protein